MRCGCGDPVCEARIAASNGDRNQLWHVASDWLERYLWRWPVNERDEVRQEVCLRYLTKLKPYDTCVELRRALVTVAKNIAADNDRKKDVRQRHQSELVAIQLQALSSASPDLSENVLAVHECMKKHAEARGVAYLRQNIFESKSYATIAENSGVPIGTVASSINAAKVTIGNCLEAKGATP